MQRTWLGWKYALLIIGLTVLAMLVMDFNNRMAELRRLESQEKKVVVQITHLVQTHAALETQIAYATSDVAVYEWAYQDGHWVREGDVRVVPLSPGDSTPVPTVPPPPTPTPPSNWEVWLSLFLDADRP
jgi:hypothetical protein